MEFREVEARPLVDVDLADWGPADWRCAVENVIAKNEIAGSIVRVKYKATLDIRKTIDDGEIKRALLDAGAVKVHGPIVETIHTASERTNTVTEEDDMQTAWQQFLVLQGVDGPRATRLTEKVLKAMEVVNA